MDAIHIKQSLIAAINSVDERDTNILEQLVVAVKNILNQKSHPKQKDDITPFVKSMEMGVKLPSDININALKEEHFKEKYS